MVSDGRIVFTGTKDQLAGDSGLEARFYELTGHPAKEVA